MRLAHQRLRQSAKFRSVEADAFRATLMHIAYPQILSGVFHFPIDISYFHQIFNTLSYEFFIRFQLQKSLQIISQTLQTHNPIFS